MAGEPNSPIERVSKLMLYLKGISYPHSQQMICEQTDLYGSNWNNESNRKKFMRDLDDIREAGYRIDQTTGENNASLYRILDSDAKLTKLNNLTPDEIIALQLATRLVDLNQDWDITAVKKLSTNRADYETTPIGELPTWGANIPVSRALPEISEAIGSRSELTFTYGDKKRVIKPLGLKSQAGRRYLAALEGDTTKTFRLDRIESEVKVGTSDGFEPQPSVDWEDLLPLDPVMMNFDTELTCVLAVDHLLADQAENTRGQVVTRNDDGSIQLEVRVRNRRAFQAWIYKLGKHAQILSPPEMIDELKQSLRHLVYEDDVNE